MYIHVYHTRMLLMLVHRLIHRIPQYSQSHIANGKGRQIGKQRSLSTTLIMRTKLSPVDYNKTIKVFPYV